MCSPGGLGSDLSVNALATLTPSALDSLLSWKRGQKSIWLGPLLLGMVGAMHGEQASTKLSSAPAPARWLPDVPPSLDFIPLTLTALLSSSWPLPASTGTMSFFFPFL